MTDSDKAKRLAERRAAFTVCFRLRDEERCEEAIVEFRKALEKWPRYTPGLIGLGDMLERLNRHEEAIEVFGRAIELRPHFLLVSAGYLFAALAARRLELVAVEARRFLPLLDAGLVEDAAEDPDYREVLVSFVEDPLGTSAAWIKSERNKRRWR